jgi:hypothetical protein
LPPIARASDGLVPYLANILETQFPDRINVADAKTLATTVVKALGGNFEKLHEFAQLAKGLDAMQTEAAAARLIATEQSLAGDSLQVFFSKLGDKIGTDPHVLQLGMLNLFRDIPLAPVGQEKGLGELVDLANTMRRTQVVGCKDVIDALDKCYIHPLFVHPKTQMLQVSRRVFVFVIDRMVDHGEYRIPASALG